MSKARVDKNLCPQVAEEPAPLGAIYRGLFHRYVAEGSQRRAAADGRQSFEVKIEGAEGLAGGRTGRPNKLEQAPRLWRLAAAGGGRDYGVARFEVAQETFAPRAEPRRERIAPRLRNQQMFVARLLVSQPERVEHRNQGFDASGQFS